MMNKLKKKLSYRSSKKKNQERFFLENGSILLEELIADCDGKSIPIRSFSSSQILEITNNFHSSYLVAVNRSHNLYCGIIENKSYLIKRFLDYKITQDKVGQVYNDIVLSARMSNHNNFLKLYGCCLEFNLPVIVLENAEHGRLNQRGSIYVNGEETSLPWNVKLNIVKEIANAVTYLHTAFSRIIIHRVVTPTNIVLDSNFTPKFLDLSMSITLPEGKTRLKTDDVIGTLGYLDPIYRATSVVTEYTDVYSFGIFLMAILTGKPALVSTSTSCGGGGVPQNLHIYVKGLYENGKLDDLMIMKDITSGQKLQLEECVKLAMSCCEERDEDRPKMIHVAKELKRIQTSS